MGGKQKPRSLRALNYTFGHAEGIRLQSLPSPGAVLDFESPVESAASGFQQPPTGSVPLASGPFLFRRRRERGGILVGTSDHALVESVQSRFSDWGPRLLKDWDRGNPPCRLQLNPRDGYIRLQFRINQHKEPEKWFWLELHPTSIPNSDQSRENVAQLVPHQNRRLVLNCMMEASLLWQRMVEEFREAVDSDVCRIYARWGSATAPSFMQIPRDIFHQCVIENWGGETSIGGRARTHSGTRLFSIFVVQTPGAVRATRAEADAIRTLQAHLQSDSEMKRDDAWAICKPLGVSLRGFLQRVWPQARKAAGLTDRAPGGRKAKKKPRVT
jgi:hypothetical protein